MKPNIRILGIDDGPFNRGMDRKTPLVGVLMRVDGVIESVVTDFIALDGDDTKGVITGFVDIIGNENVNIILTEGITFGGFDIIVPDEIYSETGIPFISITKGKGDMNSMAQALEKHGDNKKLEKLYQLRPFRRLIGGTSFTLNISGIDEKEALILIEKLMKVGSVPEPLRIADMIAASIAKSLENIP